MKRLLCLGFLMFTGCCSEDPSAQSACEPGEVRTCWCPDAGYNGEIQGHRRCLADGTRFSDECTCCPPGTIPCGYICCNQCRIWHGDLTCFQ